MSCWEKVLRILEIIVGLMVPISSVFLAYYLNKRNLEAAYKQRKIDLDADVQKRQLELTQQNQLHLDEFQRQKEKEKIEQQIKKQAEILSLLNSLYKKCSLGNYPSSEEIIDASNKLLSSYPYLGKDLYSDAVSCFEIIEIVSKRQTIFSKEEEKKLIDYQNSYVKKYTDFINN